MMAYCAAAALKRYQRSCSLGFNLPVTTLLIAPLAKWMGISLVLAIALWAPTLINAALNNSVFSARVLDKVVLLLIDNIITSLLNYMVVCQKVCWQDRKSTRLNSSHVSISYAVFCLKKNNINIILFLS